MCVEFMCVVFRKVLDRCVVLDRFENLVMCGRGLYGLIWRISLIVRVNCWCRFVVDGVRYGES